MKIETARQIVETESSSKISEITPIDFGGDSQTFRISTSQGKLILRTGGMRSNYDVEHEVLTTLFKLGTKVPEPVSEGIDIKTPELSFSLQKEIPGIDLFHSTLDIKYWPRVLGEVGSNLKIIYSVKIDGFGHISPEKFRQDGRLRCDYNSWPDFIHYYFDSRIKPLIEKVNSDKKNHFQGSNLSKEQIEKVVEIVARIPEALKKLNHMTTKLEIQGNLVHGDLSTQHILVSDNRLSGIIDFNNVLVGDSLFDIAYWSVMPQGGSYQFLLENSGVEMNEERFRLYRMLISIAKLHT